jgi:AmmeMemoRadiSam system protein A
MDLSPDHARILLDAARSVIVNRVLERVVDEASPLPADSRTLSHPAGCFVSLHEIASHRLRGCVGRIQADRPLLEAFRDSAGSVLRDPRFYDDRIRPEELAQIELEVSVLAPPRRIGSVSEYEPLRDGVIVRIGERSGLFLPQVARETGWTRVELLNRLCTEKLGLPPDAWQDPDAELLVFATAILGPEPLLPRSQGPLKTAAST